MIRENEKCCRLFSNLVSLCTANITGAEDITGSVIVVVAIAIAAVDYPARRREAAVGAVARCERPSTTTLLQPDSRVVAEEGKVEGLSKDWCSIRRPTPEPGAGPSRKWGKRLPTPSLSRFRSSAANSAQRTHPINFCPLDHTAPPDPIRLN
ncbi:hypothetical protein J6590_027939 [Homalodisca vitripennis]|nr:hypothetical protein J6590_027939 [Homalodisca vitripennis]